MACYVPWLVALLLMVVMERASGQAVQYTDPQAGQKLDILTPRGVGLAIKWHDRFWPQLMAVKNSLETAENLLTSVSDPSTRVNLTARVEEKLVAINVKVDEVLAQGASLGFNNTDDDLIAYMKTPHSTLNNGGHFSDDVFTVPKAGLYKILMRNIPGWSFSTATLSKNGIETLATLSGDSYFDVKTRVRLVWLEEDDEVYTTGATPEYFLILHLRVQTLMPDYLNH